MTDRDVRFMRRALELAARGEGRTAPSPLVGAVVVRGGRIVGEGYYKAFGGPHAEVHALRAAGPRARGATMYLTLEPCSPHPKKTPPCSELVSRSGLARLVVAMRDPNPLVDGRGIARVRRAGIRVTTGVLAAEARALNAPYVKFHTRGLPYVVAKWAMTLDGKIATRTGDSRWVSGERSRAWLHRFRDSFQAILVGAGTLLRDDPMLRGARRRPARIVLDSLARTPPDANVVRTAGEQPTWLAVSPAAPEGRLRELRRRGVQVLQLDVRDLRLVFEALAREGFQKILVEGGGEVHASLFEEAGLVDEVCVFVAPKVVGGREAKTPVEGEGLDRMAQALRLERVAVERIGEDLLVRGRVRW
ncbi:MAG TPA: bifunctional diaminohydroxyphosphoribosylaminopyrimidine deaminase/5-amino-6-(5-phosphoribosylamino)uracil reductase RibD [Planctomycetota bacterium]|nr:bifunctional diaminohydroxyphosphoribosylaminopyrimidine deaminase/5-amino-6-(5-phosphoribosylamino)uracil reductase RibD [Planctomycetota bacterium]